MNKKILMFVPLLGILGVCVLLLAGLNQDPRQLASVLIGKPVPEFYQADLAAPTHQRSLKDFPPQPFLLNIWGSWCHYCREEHPLLTQIARDIPIIGINYRDKPQSGIAMLQSLGDPYLFSINDSRGELAMKLGVDGAPETYLIDRHGIIRHRHSGVLDTRIWQQDFLPKIKELREK